jgi:exopolysaccharide biosynthesis polyprenyl glycosylphosphotransferase
MSTPGDQVAAPLPQGLTLAGHVRGLGRHSVRLDRGGAQLLAAAGRVAVVWLPLFAFCTRDRVSLSEAFLLSAVLTFVWSIGLRGAFTAARSTFLAIGLIISSFVGSAIGLVLVSAANVWLPWIELATSDLLQIAAVIFVLTALWESLTHGSVAAEQRLLIVGADERGAEIIDQITSLHDSPYEVVGIVIDDEELFPGELARLPAIVEYHRPDLVVMLNHRPEAFDALLDLAASGFKVVGPPEFYEHAFGRVPVELLSQSWFMNVLHLYRKPYTRFAKRAFDVVVASFGLLLTAPLYPVLAWIVARTPGPVIFRQVRLGEGGVPFTIYKFRTMRQDAEVAGAVWAAERDPRVTRAGAFMRKTRLDELPQLWNVLRGEMSIVGPRPERPEFMAELQEAVPFWSRRHLVKPGITGWAQVRRGYTADADGTAEKLAYDLWYLRHRSLVLDLAICVKTFTTLVTGSGAR